MLARNQVGAIGELQVHQCRRTMTDGTHDALLLIDGGCDLEQSLSLGKIPYRAMPASKEDGLIIRRIDLAGREGLLQLARQIGRLNKLSVDRISEIVATRIYRSLAALRAHNIDLGGSKASPQQGLNGMSDLGQVVTGLTARRPKSMMAGHRNEHFFVLHVMLFLLFI